MKRRPPRSAVLALALASLLAGGCVSRAFHDREMARLGDEADARTQRIAELEQRVRDLEMSGEQLELERSSLEQERLQLIRGLEELRSGNARMRIEMDERAELNRERDEARAEHLRRLVAELQPDVKAGRIELDPNDGRLRISAHANALFESGSTRVRPDGRQLLGRIARELSGLPDGRVRVEGHTDSTPIATDRFPSNWELSAARAAAVVRELVELGVPPEALAAVGRGPFVPLADNETPEGRAQNRRIEIVVHFEGED